MSNNSSPRRVLHTEDWFCGLGVLCASLITTSASWAPHDLAKHLLDGGLTTAGSFIGLWFLAKVVRVLGRR